jgi:hypothetical protein
MISNQLSTIFFLFRYTKIKHIIFPIHKKSVFTNYQQLLINSLAFVVLFLIEHAEDHEMKNVQYHHDD